MGRNSRLGLVGLVLGGSLFASGCANLGPADYAGAALTAGAGPIAGRFGQNAGLAAGVAGSLSSTSGSREHDLNVARQTGAGYGGAGYVGSGMADPSYHNAVRARWADRRGVIFTCEQCASSHGNYCGPMFTRKGAEDKFDSTYFGVKRVFGSDEPLLIAWDGHEARIGGFPPFLCSYALTIRVYKLNNGACELFHEATGYEGFNTLPIRNLIGDGKAELWLSKPRDVRKLSETYFKVIDNAAQKISEEAGGKAKIIELIKGYKDLRDKGILTEDDYQKKVQPLLNQL